jgi:hypothetical protein
MKLGACVRNEVDKHVGGVGLTTKREGPHIVRVVINDNEILPPSQGLRPIFFQKVKLCQV